MADLILHICSIIKSLCALDYTLVFIWMEIQIQQVNGVKWCFNVLFHILFLGLLVQLSSNAKQDILGWTMWVFTSELKKQLECFRFSTRTWRRSECWCFMSARFLHSYNISISREFYCIQIFFMYFLEICAVKYLYGNLHN